MARYVDWDGGSEFDMLRRGGGVGVEGRQGGFIRKMTLE